MRITQTGRARINKIKFRPNLLLETILRINNPRLDQHLPRANINSLDKGTNFFQLGRNIRDEQDVRLLVRHRTATLAENALGSAAPQGDCT